MCIPNNVLQYDGINNLSPGINEVHFQLRKYTLLNQKELHNTQITITAARTNSIPTNASALSDSTYQLLVLFP